MKWSEVQQGENGSGDRGAGKEVDHPGIWVVLRSRVEGNPSVEVVEPHVEQEAQPVHQERGGKVDPSPSHTSYLSRAPRAVPVEKKSVMWRNLST